MSDTRSILRLGTRGSILARMQSQLIADLLEKTHEGLHVELVIVKTTGDSIVDRPLSEAGGKGLFVKELELALLRNEVDFAVHSFKDVPVTMPLVDQSELTIGVVSAREDARDTLIHRPDADFPDGSVNGNVEAGSVLALLPAKALVGTSSTRRKAQVLHRRPDLRIAPVRGNIDTRLGKLAEGEFDAIILAMAGLRRTALFDSQVMRAIPFDEMLPAPGQGALALQSRRADEATLKLLRVLHDPGTAICVEAERAVVRYLHGDCHSPIAALATLEGSAAETLRLRCAVGGREGMPPVIFAEASASSDHPASAVERVCAELTRQGAEGMLR